MKPTLMLYIASVCARTIFSNSEKIYEIKIHKLGNFQGACFQGESFPNRVSWKYYEKVLLELLKNLENLFKQHDILN